ncbi:hypothetical protein N7540_013220 [Penicillium herquei]|nr:hypothetical protein N7540_013220 [Penicillium herquei]
MTGVGNGSAHSAPRYPNNLKQDTKLKITGSQVPYRYKSPDYSKLIFHARCGSTLNNYTLSELKGLAGGSDALENFEWYQKRRKEIEDYVE